MKDIKSLWQNVNQIKNSSTQYEFEILITGKRLNLKINCFYSHRNDLHTIENRFDKTNFYSVFDKIEEYNKIVNKDNLLSTIMQIFTFGLFTLELTQIIDNFIIFVKYIKNYTIFKEICLKGIELNHDISAYKLAIYYRDVEKNIDKMKDYLSIAINLGNLYSIFLLAYQLGKEQNIIESINFYELFIEKYNKQYPTKITKLNSDKKLMDNYLCACHNLGLHFLYDNIDYDKMKKYLNYGIEFNSSISAYLLGCYYRDYEQNTRLMKKCFEIGVKNNHDDSILSLAKFYKEKENNIEEAKKFYRILLCSNNIYAIIELAKIEESENNFIEAINYYLRAFRLGDEQSSFDISRIYKNNLNDIMNSIHILIDCIEKHKNEYAMIQVANLFREINDIDKFKFYLNMAIEKKNFEAFYYLGNYYEEIGEIEKAFDNYLMGKRFKNEDCEDKISNTNDFFKLNIQRILNYCLTKFKEYNSQNYLTNQKIKVLRNIYFQNTKKCYFYLIMTEGLIDIKTIDNDFIDEHSSQNKSVFKEVKLEKPDTCPITCDEETIMYQTRCKHNFSRIILFMNIQTCPMCRSNLKN